MARARDGEGTEPGREQPKPLGRAAKDQICRGRGEGGDQHRSTPGIAVLREEANESGLDQSRAVEKERRGPVPTARGLPDRHHARAWRSGRLCPPSQPQPRSLAPNPQHSVSLPRAPSVPHSPGARRGPAQRPRPAAAPMAPSAPPSRSHSPRRRPGLLLLRFAVRMKTLAFIGLFVCH